MREGPDETDLVRDAGKFRDWKARLDIVMNGLRDMNVRLVAHVGGAEARVLLAEAGD